jgi:AcrR family transcriptional regulator
MGPIRREQICRAAATVIAREGFAGTTMRMIAAEAGVSTGMINHYFVSREALLTQALVFVSEQAQQRHRARSRACRRASSA